MTALCFPAYSKCKDLTSTLFVVTCNIFGLIILSFFGIIQDPSVRSPRPASDDHFPLLVFYRSPRASSNDFFLRQAFPPWLVFVFGLCFGLGCAHGEKVCCRLLASIYCCSMKCLPTVVAELLELRCFMDSLAILGLRREVFHQHKREVYILMQNSAALSESHGPDHAIRNLHLPCPQRAKSITAVGSLELHPASHSPNYGGSILGFYKFAFLTGRV